MKNALNFFSTLVICSLLISCNRTPETQTTEAAQVQPLVQQMQLGNLTLTIAEDPTQALTPGFSLDGTTPHLGDEGGSFYHFMMNPGMFSVDLSQFAQVQNSVPLREVSNMLSNARMSSYIILYLTNNEEGILDEAGTFNVFSTSIVNTFLLVDQREMASIAKLAKTRAKVFQFSWVEVIGDRLVDFAEESFYNAAMYIKSEESQEELLTRYPKDCQPGSRWSCVLFNIVDENGNSIPGATVSVKIGLFEHAGLADEWGKLAFPLYSAYNSNPNEDDRKFFEYTIKAWADGYGMWDGGNCKIFSLPNESKTYTIVIPKVGVADCSGMTEENSEQQTQPTNPRILPENFYLIVSEYVEEWEWGALTSACVIERRFEQGQMLDERTMLVKGTSSLLNTVKGDCSSKVYDPVEIQLDVFSGTAMDAGSMNLFAGQQSQPAGSSPSMFNNLSVWVTTNQEEIPSSDNVVYHYSYENTLDQFTGIRIYRLINGSRVKDGAKDEGYCRWQQTQALSTNAPIGGNPGGYTADYPLMKSGCADLEQAIEAPLGDPCIVMKNYYDWMNEENVDLFFQNFLTEGWSSGAFQKEIDWHKWYFSEYDVRYTLNSCKVEWKASVPPFSAILVGNVHSDSVYKGNQSQSDLDVKMYAVYRNGDWFAVRGWSVEDVNQVTVPFINNTDGVVEVYWIDYEKNERSWFELQPGEQREITTAVTHVWTVYDKGSGERLAFVVIFPNPQLAIIQRR